MSWIENNEWLQPAKKQIDWAPFRRFLSNYRAYRHQLGITVCLAILSSLSAALIAPLFGLIQRSLYVHNSARLAELVAAWLGLMLLQTGITWLVGRSRIKVSTGLNESLLLAYYRKLLNISAEDFLEFKRKSNLFQRVIDAMSVTQECTEIVVSGLQSSIVFLVTLTVILFVSAKVSIVVFVGCVALFAYVFSISREAQERRSEFLAVNYPLIGKMLEAIEGFFTIKALSGSIAITSDIATLVQSRSFAERRELGVQIKSNLGTTAISLGIQAAVLCTSFLLAQRSSLSYANVFALYILVAGLLGQVTELARLLKSVAALSANIRNYYQVVDIPDEAAGLSSSLPATTSTHLPPIPVAPSERAIASHSTDRIRQPRSQIAFSSIPDMDRPGRIEFRDVHFGYRGVEPVFRGLSFTIEPGERVSLIGRSGVGKTTLMRLLMGFLLPQSGTILVDGHDLQTCSSLDEYRRQFGFVSQQDFFFGTSLRENLCFGLDRTCSDEELNSALCRVDLLSCIDALPEGLGAVYSGDRFSGGQQQRFFLARALLRQAPIVLLDEPTSALDYENEELVLRAIEALASGRTTITIAHRHSTVRHSDRVLVLGEGRVMVSGQHEDLYANDAYYRSFCDYNSFIV